MSFLNSHSSAANSGPYAGSIGIRAGSTMVAPWASSVGDRLVDDRVDLGAHGRVVGALAPDADPGAVERVGVEELACSR